MIFVFFTFVIVLINSEFIELNSTEELNETTALFTTTTMTTTMRSIYTTKALKKTTNETTTALSKEIEKERKGDGDEEDVVLQASNSLLSRIVEKSKDRRIKRKFQDQIMRENEIRLMAMKKATKDKRVDFEDEGGGVIENPGSLDYTLIMAKEEKKEKEGSFETIKDAFKEKRLEEKRNKILAKNADRIEFYKQRALQNQP